MKLRNATARRFGIGALVSLMAMTAGVGASARDLIVEVEGRRVDLGHRQRAYMDRGVWMIPAQPVLRAGGVWSRWDSRRGELEIAAGYGRFVVFADSWTIIVGSRREALSRPVAVHHGAPFVPVEFLERCLRMRAVYDPRDDVLCFGERPRWRHDVRDRWRFDDRERWRYDDRRNDYRRDRGFYMDPPGRRFGSSVDFRGRWGGNSVRIRVYRDNGSVCINRSAGVRNGEWSAALSLSSGKYRAVVEAMDGVVVAHRREVEFEVR